MSLTAKPLNALLLSNMAGLLLCHGVRRGCDGATRRTDGPAAGAELIASAGGSLEQHRGAGMGRPRQVGVSDLVLVGARRPGLCVLRPRLELGEGRGVLVDAEDHQVALVGP